MRDLLSLEEQAEGRAVGEKGSAVVVERGAMTFWENV